MSKFQTEKQFQEYCKRVRLNLDTASPVQVIEMRRAFSAGVVQTLLHLRDDISEMTEDEIVEELRAILDENAEFWKRQAKGGRHS